MQGLLLLISPYDLREDLSLFILRKSRYKVKCSFMAFLACDCKLWQRKFKAFLLQ